MASVGAQKLLSSRHLISGSRQLTRLVSVWHGQRSRSTDQVSDLFIHASRLGKLVRHVHASANALCSTTNNNNVDANDGNNTVLVLPAEAPSVVKRKDQTVNHVPVAPSIEHTQVAPPSGGHEYLKKTIRVRVPGDAATTELASQPPSSVVGRPASGRVLTANVVDSSEHIVHPRSLIYDDGILDDLRSLEDVRGLEKKFPFRRGAKKIPVVAYNLAAYVNDSETLQSLVRLGTDLSEVERDTEMAEYIVKMDFTRDAEPYLRFLYDLGVADDRLGHVIAKNPRIFKENLDDLEVRVNYFKSKKFSLEDVARIVSKSPWVLSRTTLEIDRQLGQLQQEFSLSGNELRLAVIRLPRLIVRPLRKVKQNHVVVRDFLGFKPSEVRQLLLSQPKIFELTPENLMTRFDYLHNTMQLPHDRVLHWPEIFTTRVFILRQRHLFLRSIGRAQYDPAKENYVSLKALVACRDKEFCANVAKVPESQFSDFLQTE